MPHAGKVLPKVVAGRLSAYREAKELLPEELCGFRPNRSITNMMFVVRRLQEIGRKTGQGVYFFMCFIDLQKACGIVDRTLLWQVLSRIGAPPQIIAVLQQFPAQPYGQSKAGFDVRTIWSGGRQYAGGVAMQLLFITDVCPSQMMIDYVYTNSRQAARRG